MLKSRTNWLSVSLFPLTSVIAARAPKELLRDTDQTAPPRPWPAPNWPPDSGSSWLDMLGRRRSPRGIKPYLNELREAKRSEKKRCSLLRKDTELLRGMDGSDVGIAELTAALEEAEARLAHITGLIAELEQPSPSGPGTWLKVSWSNASNQSRPPAPPQTHTHTHTNAYGARGLKIFCFAADAAVPLRRTGLRP